MNEIGVIGLSTMGKNIALNMADHGFKVAVYNRTYQNTLDILEVHNQRIKGYEELRDFVGSIEKPRKILMLVKAGEAVDEVINSLKEYMDEDDIIMDGGNSYYGDTIARYNSLHKDNIHFFGIGVSGGEMGARFGASIMPAGNKEIYPLIEPYLKAIAAKYDDEYCVSYIGNDGAGHFVKMVHNGIEYGDMQLISEMYLILKEGGFNNKQISEIFASWNNKNLASYLLKITSEILMTKDLDKKYVIDYIKDEASHKGTGKWTSIDSLNEGYKVPLIIEAFMARVISQEKRFIKNKRKNIVVDIKELKKAYHLVKVMIFNQGFQMMKEASNKHNWNLDLKEVAKIFRAGCIIQTSLLDEIVESIEGNMELLDISIYKDSEIKALKEVNVASIKADIPTPVLMRSLTFINQMTARIVGANLIQAQRDYFGAHGFERTDVEGIFHHDWYK